jgi:hypothetical protein
MTFEDASTGNIEKVSVDFNEVLERNQYLELCLQTAQAKIVDLTLAAINNETTFKIQLEKLQQQIINTNGDKKNEDDF